MHLILESNLDDYKLQEAVFLLCFLYLYDTRRKNKQVVAALLLNLSNQSDIWMIIITAMILKHLSVILMF